MKFFSHLKHALRGFSVIFSQCLSFRLEFFFVMLSYILAFALDLRILEWIVIFISSFLIFALEIINSTLEKSLDIIKPQYHNVVRDIKDMLAGLVLLSALLYFGLCMLIFYQHILGFFLF